MRRAPHRTPPADPIARLGRTLGCLALAILGAACGETPPPEPTEPVVARAALDRSTATLGDRITYTLTVDRNPDLQVELPEPTAGLEDQPGLTVLEHGREAPRRVGNRVVEEIWTRLRADQLGSYVLPPRTVRWQPAETKTENGGEQGNRGESPELESLETAALYLEVESVLPEVEGEITDIRDLKPLAPPPSRLVPGLILAAVLAALATALLLWWLRRTREPTPEPPGPPPHERVLAILDALEPKISAALEADDRRALRRLYFQLSEAVRRYTEQRFGLNATDLTSEEIVAALPEVRGLSPEPAVELRRFLVDTDLVKFASHRPGDDEVRRTLARARGFVETTRRRQAPTEDPAEASP